MKRFILLPVLILFLLWLSGFFYFVYSARSYAIDTRTTTDAIVVLTGGNQRINTGVNLLKAGFAPILFISGVESPNQLRNFLVEKKVNLDQVLYGLNAATTQDNAKEVADFISAHSIDSIRLVTSYYHMPRALVAIQKVVPASTIIIPHVVVSDIVNYVILFKEYHKYMVMRLLNYNF